MAHKKIGPFSVWIRDAKGGGKQMENLAVCMELHKELPCWVESKVHQAQNLVFNSGRPDASLARLMGRPTAQFYIGPWHLST